MKIDIPHQLNEIQREQLILRKAQLEAEGYLELGLYHLAIRKLQELGPWEDHLPEIQYIWGEALREQGRFVEAIGPLTACFDELGYAVPVAIALGWCHKRTGRVDLAIDALEESLECNAGQALLHFNLACYWCLVGSKSEALVHLEKALTIDECYARLVDEEEDLNLLRNDPRFEQLCGKKKTIC